MVLELIVVVYCGGLLLGKALLTAAARGLNISRAPCDGQLQKLVSNPFSGSGRSQPQPAISRPWKTAVGTSLCQISCQPRTQLHVQISWQAQQIVR